MPELPDLLLYREAIESRIAGHRLQSIDTGNPFLLRTVDPPLGAFHSLAPSAVRLVGKRICIGFEGDLWLAIHLMIAGRLHWNKRGGKPLLRLRFSSGDLTLTEAGSERRASLHAFRGGASLLGLDKGGVDPLSASLPEFSDVLRRENHTLKRALTDPSLFSGIGNAFSDEILHHAKLSPLTLTSRLQPGEIARLRLSVIDVLNIWISRLREQAGGKFPEKVTAFRPDMAVHGRYRQPCPVCGGPVQRIRHATNETNYCPGCQTGGRLLADRAMSRLLKQDWPRSLEQS